jgi:hypothetical protein
MSLRFSSTFGACLAAASGVTILGYLLFRGGLHPGAAPALRAGALLIAPGSFVVIWIPEFPFPVWTAVLLVSNTALWAAVLYLSVFMFRKLRHAPGRA